MCIFEVVDVCTSFVGLKKGFNQFYISCQSFKTCTDVDQEKINTEGEKIIIIYLWVKINILTKIPETEVIIIYPKY